MESVSPPLFHQETSSRQFIRPMSAANKHIVLDPAWGKCTAAGIQMTVLPPTTHKAMKRNTPCCRSLCQTFTYDLSEQLWVLLGV